MNAAWAQCTRPCSARMLLHAARRVQPQGACAAPAARAPHELEAGCLRKRFELRRDVSRPHLRRPPHGRERLCAA